MTAQPPSDPRSSRRHSLDFDEFIAVLVAFASLGTVLAWGLTRGNDNFLANQPRLVAIPGLAGEQPQTATPERDAENPLIAPAVTERQVTENRATENPVTENPTGFLPLEDSVTGVTSPSAPTVILPAPIPLEQTDQTPTAIDRSAAPPASPVVAPFPDVPSSYWAAPFIAALTQRGDISGFQNGTFRPDQPVTRAEFATLIQNTFNQTNQQSPIAFKDISGNFWAASAIDSAVQTGFLKGFPDGTFQPDLPIPRIQVFAALTSGLKLAPPSNPPLTLQLFRDQNLVPKWGIPAAAAATQSGLVVNHPSPDILNPNQPATRADVAAFLYQALVSTGQVAPIASPYLVQP